MLKLACNNNPCFEVSDIELSSSRQPYTYETLQKISKLYSDYEIRLIIGTDNLKELNWWYEINNLLENFKIIVLARDEDSVNNIIKNDTLLAKYKNSFITYNTQIRTNLSSTYVRNLIKDRKNVKYLLPDAVIDYIYKNNLYLD